MRRLKKPLAAVVSICLLMLQLSGAHVHANDSGYLGMPEVSYNHTHEQHHDGDAQHHDDGGRESDHHHEVVHDVSLIDPALATFKMPLALFAAPILFAHVPVVTVLASADVIYPVLSGRHARWRPPLRAPPLQA